MTTEVSLSQPLIMNSKGQVIPIEHTKLTSIIYRALKAAENPDQLLALNLADKVMRRLVTCKGIENPISMEEIHDMTEFVLFETGNFRAAKELIISRQRNGQDEEPNLG
jgi:hypothetical protein